MIPISRSKGLIFINDNRFLPRKRWTVNSPSNTNHLDCFAGGENFFLSVCHCCVLQHIITISSSVIKIKCHVIVQFYLFLTFFSIFFAFRLSLFHRTSVELKVCFVICLKSFHVLSHDCKSITAAVVLDLFQILYHLQNLSWSSRRMRRSRDCWMMTSAQRSPLASLSQYFSVSAFDLNVVFFQS